MFRQIERPSLCCIALSAVPPSFIASVFSFGMEEQRRRRIGLCPPHTGPLPLRSEAASSLIFVFFTQKKSKVGQILALPRAPCSNHQSRRAAVLWVCLQPSVARAAPHSWRPLPPPPLTLYGPYLANLFAFLCGVRTGQTCMHSSFIHPLRTSFVGDSVAESCLISQ